VINAQATTIPMMAMINMASAILSRRCILRRPPRAQRQIRKQTRDQKQQCGGGEQIIRRRVRGPERDNNTDQSNNGQANADHRRRDSEDVDANVLLELAVCTALRFCFSFHETIT
jgi:hypothetical protein